MFLHWTEMVSSAALQSITPSVTYRNERVTFYFKILTTVEFGQRFQAQNLITRRSRCQTFHWNISFFIEMNWILLSKAFRPLQWRSCSTTKNSCRNDGMTPYAGEVIKWNYAETQRSLKAEVSYTRQGHLSQLPKDHLTSVWVCVCVCASACVLKRKGHGVINLNSGIKDH